VVVVVDADQLVGDGFGHALVNQWNPLSLFKPDERAA
jgi:hypothetical protein